MKKLNVIELEIGKTIERGIEVPAAIVRIETADDALLECLLTAMSLIEQGHESL